MPRKAYKSDIIDEQWQLLQPLIPPEKPGGRHRTVDMREVLNSIFYILCGGGAWLMMPHDLPLWQTVYHYFRLWRIDGVWQQMNQALRKKSEARAGRKPTPSVAIIDSQSFKTTEIGQEVGYDGAKLIKGHKRHILVDTLGLLLQVFVSAANVLEKAGAILILEKIKDKLPRLCRIFSDGGYEGRDFVQLVKDDHHLDGEIVKRDKRSQGFKVLLWRWRVERTFAWLLRYRRLTIGYEALTATSEASIYAAMYGLWSGG